ncbi:PAS domain-containing protein [Tepidiphilus baoligensis]|uniref:PAS domain-containing protein n=1 Tax=Tepidiphilus baoligensis TaxID=2698687 RepID=A0ABX1QM15_9PROT|nr:PAS domain-containing protein [Tepidiphilus baoligensis]NMH16254.1 PAS domain-containing protein [Tepidiphilus baoligensis]
MKHPSLIPSHEILIPGDRLLVCKTGPDGRITYCNPAFLHFTGHRLKELLGRKHSALRHPDMPKGLFAHLWRHLEQGQEWFGFLKNLTARGDFFWSFAQLMPDRNGDELHGYHAIYRPAPRSALPEIETLYGEMRRIEHEAKHGAAAASSLAWLERRLGDLHRGYERWIFRLLDLQRSNTARAA